MPGCACSNPLSLSVNSVPAGVSGSGAKSLGTQIVSEFGVGGETLASGLGGVGAGEVAAGVTVDEFPPPREQPARRKIPTIKVQCKTVLMTPALYSLLST
jgi:hypothetical protein